MDTKIDHTAEKELDMYSYWQGAVSENIKILADKKILVDALRICRNTLPRIEGRDARALQGVVGEALYKTGNGGIA